MPNTDALIGPGIILTSARSTAAGAAQTNPFQGQIDQTTAADAPLYRGPLGTPVMADVTFKGGSYTDENGKTVTFGDLTLVTVLLTVHQAKNIIKTTIQGRNGTVKEYIGEGDYEVSIEGKLTGKNGQFPATEMQALKAILKAPIAIEIVAKYLQTMDIFTVVIDDYTLPQEAGMYSTQPFSISALSDTPIELLIV